MLDQFDKNKEESTLGNHQEHLRIRCPKCFKPFLVREALITYDEPQFACNQCDTQFWIPYKESKGLDEFLGIELALNHLEIEEAPQVSTSITESMGKTNIEKTSTEAFQFRGERACPKCGRANSFQTEECTNCGVIISRYELISKEDNPHVPVHLMESWQAVMDDYENEQVHTSFLNKCQKIRQLQYASKKYSSILNVYGGDERALNMKKQVVALAQTDAGLTRPQKVETKGIAFKPRKRKTGIFAKLLLSLVGVGMVLFFAGQFFPELRNLMGLGASLIFISLTLLIYTR
ncbi:MAG: hypothetical protein HOO06_02825 [Bdellovibrionaceae bacterium]|jgi:hypothetical protein|nr:hypothetical protein [Pseudobdellovibrionaceae bacterium]